MQSIQRMPYSYTATELGRIEGKLDVIRIHMEVMDEFYDTDSTDALNDLKKVMEILAKGAERYEKSILG